jgi:hypothetical protein
VPQTGILGPWAITQPATSYPEQYFFKRSALGARRSARAGADRSAERLATAVVGPSAERRAPSTGAQRP